MSSGGSGKGGQTQQAAGTQTGGFGGGDQLAGMGQPIGATAPSYGAAPNVYEQSSQGLTGAFNTAYGGLAQNFLNPSGYDPSFVGQPGSIQGGIEGYMNPYTDQVINRTMDDMERMRGIQQVGIEGSAAQAEAFGGSRQGLVESELNRNFMQQTGDMSANMRNLAYGQAANLSGQDISNMMTSGFANQNAANLGGFQNAMLQNQQFGNTMQGAGMLGDLSQQAFGFGQDITQQQTQAGLMQQALQQSVMNQGAGLYEGYANSPQQVFNLRLSALGQNPLNAESTTTVTKQPGMFDYLQMGAGLGSAAMGAGMFGNPGSGGT